MCCFVCCASGGCAVPHWHVQFLDVLCAIALVTYRISILGLLPPNAVLKTVSCVDGASQLFYAILLFIDRYLLITAEICVSLLFNAFRPQWIPCKAQLMRWVPRWSCARYLQVWLPEHCTSSGEAKSREMGVVVPADLRVSRAK
jgi:hypothetical protein